MNNEVYSHSHDHHYPHDPMNPHNPNHPHPALLDPSVMKNLEEDEDGDMEDQQQQQQQQQDEGEDANYIRERMRRAMQNDPFLNQTQQQVKLGKRDFNLSYFLFSPLQLTPLQLTPQEREETNGGDN